MSANIKRVLVFGMTPNYGGVESFILNYYSNMDRSKIVLDFLCNTHDDLAYSAQLREMGSTIFHITPKGENPFKYKRELRAFFKHNAKNYDSIWVNVCNLVNIDYLKLAKKYGIKKRIIHSHNTANYEHNWRDVMHCYHRRIIKKYATDFWACSKMAAKWFYLDDALESSMVVYNAIDIDSYQFSESKRRDLQSEYELEGKFVLGNVGRLTYQKNQTFLLELMKSFNDDFRLVIVGGGELDEELKSQARQLGVADKVRFVGAQTDIQAWLSSFDVFVFPSHYEGLAFTLIEAQANGVHCIVSDCAFNDEAVVNDNISVCAANDIASWKEEIQKVMDDGTRIAPDQIKSNFEKTRYDIKAEALFIQEKL